MRDAFDEEDVRAVIDEQTLTTDTPFRAVFYSGAVEPLRDGLTLAPNLQQAMQLTAESGNFDWLVMANPAGEITVTRYR